MLIYRAIKGHSRRMPIRAIEEYEYARMDVPIHIQRFIWFVAICLLMTCGSCSDITHEASAGVIRLLDVAANAGSIKPMFELDGMKQRDRVKIEQLHSLGKVLGQSDLEYYCWKMPLVAAVYKNDNYFKSSFNISYSGRELELLDDQLDLLSTLKQGWSFWDNHPLISKYTMLESEMDTQATFIFENTLVRFSIVAFEHFSEGNEPQIEVYVDDEKIGTAIIKTHGTVQEFQLPCVVDPGEHVIRLIKPDRVGKLFIYGLIVGPMEDAILIALDSAYDKDAVIDIEYPSCDPLARELLTLVKENAIWNKQQFKPLSRLFHQITMETESRSHKRTLRTLFMGSNGCLHADIVVPPHAKLIFNYGFYSQFVDSLNLTISKKGTGDVLFSKHYPAHRISEKTWYQAAEDLSALAGSRVHVTFELKGIEGVRSAVMLGEPVIRSQIVSRDKRKPNVILVSLDTLRADHLSIYGYERRTSPYLESVMSSAVLFKAAYSQASWTLPSHISMLSGVYPQLFINNHPNFDYKVPYSENIPRIASILSNEGYYCIGVVEGGYVSSFFGFAKGYDLYNELNWANNNKKTLTERGERMMKREEVSVASEWLQNYGGDSPFFMFIHTFAVHAPYIPPPKYDGLFDTIPGADKSASINHYYDVFIDGALRKRKLSDKEIDVLNLLYDRQIRWADDLIAGLFESLENAGILEETLVIITSDHGEEFMEHGSLEHAKTVYNELIHVPLIIRFPEKKWSSRAIEGEVAVMDIVPTILDYLNIGMQSDIQGKSLLPLIAGEEAGESKNAVIASSWYLEGTKIAAVKNGLKYILSIGASDKIIEELYDIEDDPRESNNIVLKARGNREKEFDLLRAEIIKFISENSQGWKVLIYPENSEEKIGVSIAGIDPRPSSWFIESECKEGENLVLANNTYEVESIGKPILLLIDGVYDHSFEINIHARIPRKTGDITVGAPSLRLSKSPLILRREDESGTLRVSHALNVIASRYLAVVWHTTVKLGLFNGEVQGDEESIEMNKALRNLGYIQ